jgi:ATP-dependent helicase HrpB
VARSQRETGAEGAGSELSDGRLLALAYPERVAKARGSTGEYRLASGRGVFVDAAEALAREPWLAVGELGGGEARDRILLAAPLEGERLLQDFEDQLETTELLQTDGQGRLRARRVTRLGRLEVRSEDVPADRAVIRRALLDQVRERGLSALPPSPALEQLRARYALLLRAHATGGMRFESEGEAWPNLADTALIARLEDWLPPLIDKRTSLGAVPPEALAAAVADLLPWSVRRDLDRLAPTHWPAPTGTRLPIDYTAEGGPEASVRLQELFGLGAHPMAAGIPLRLVLLSPAHRPIQTTADLPGFWRGSYAAVRSEMRGRYPKHPWPEDPLSAPPTTRAKPRGT